ncbi:MAG: biopolymer transporter ExbD [Acidobacteriota bacterium]|nr:biopolymer transporter ExbD [Acidobacteriota bacterium]
MNRIATATWGRPWLRVWSIMFVVFATMLFAARRYSAQTLRKGVSVEMAPTQNAVAMPEADNEGALIVAVTHSGNVYFGIDPITPAALAEKRGLAGRTGEKLYIKADARTPYANVARVLDAVHKAGVTAPSLLTGQHETPEPGKPVPPMGLEVMLGPPLPSGTEPTVVQILNSGKQWPLVKINNKDTPWTNLESRLKQLYQNQSKKVVLLNADGLLPYGDIIHVIDACRAAEAKVFLVTPAT